MTNFKINDWIQLKDPFYFEGQNLGKKRGYVVSTKGHIIVEIYLDSGQTVQVKAFRNEVEFPPYFEETITTDPDEDTF